MYQTLNSCERIECKTLTKTVLSDLSHLQIEIQTFKGAEFYLHVSCLHVSYLCISCLCISYLCIFCPGILNLDNFI